MEPAILPEEDEDRYFCCEYCGLRFDTHSAGALLDSAMLAEDGWRLIDPDEDGSIVCDDCFYTRITRAEGA